MEKFNLEKAKDGEPICTRSGEERIFIGYNSIMKSVGYPIEAFERFGLVSNDYDIDGYFIGKDNPCDEDLMMV